MRHYSVPEVVVEAIKVLCDNFKSAVIVNRMLSLQDCYRATYWLHTCLSS